MKGVRGKINDDNSISKLQSKIRETPAWVKAISTQIHELSSILEFTKKVEGVENWPHKDTPYLCMHTMAYTRPHIHIAHWYK